MIVFSSSGFADEHLFSFCSHKLNKVPQDITCCVITTAAIPDKENNRWVLFTKQYLLGKGILRISYFDFESDPPEELHKYNLIIIAGGNPYSLFYFVKKSHSEPILKTIADSQNIIVGISAGAMLFTSGLHYISEWNRIMGFDSSKDNSIGLADLDGLKVVDMIVFPHYDLFLQKNPRLEEELRRIEDRDGIKIYRLNNDRSFFLEQGRIVLIN